MDGWMGIRASEMSSEINGETHKKVVKQRMLEEGEFRCVVFFFLFFFFSSFFFSFSKVHTYR